MSPALAVAIIPVRLSSKRLPGKALLAESGRPLFLHTWQQAMAASRFSAVYIATDSDEIASAARSAGAEVLATSSTPRTGSERCAEAAASIEAECIVDIQGDWPEIDPDDLDRLVDCLADEGAACATLATEITDAASAGDPNVVKLVCDSAGEAMYFSRSEIPYLKPGDGYVRLRHIGVYGFQTKSLLSIPDLPSSGLAEGESLEQLRFLENGIRIRVLVTNTAPWGIESPADYAAFLTRLRGPERQK